MTRVQVLEAQLRAAEASSKKHKNNKKLVEQPTQLEDNINQLNLEGDARTVDDAISVLSGSAPKVDKHPEKRMKAAFNEFEQKRYRILKEENPTLKRSQLKDILWKEWQKSPENPMNQIPPS